MPMTINKIYTALGGIVAVIAVVTAGYNFTVWVDDMFIDGAEMQIIIDKQNGILNVMNNNIINIGSAIYDRKIDEIDRWIKDLSARMDKNAAEKAFLITLREQRGQVVVMKEKLSKIKVSY